MLTQEILTKIKDEITLDPEGMGYKGKTATEIIDLLNNPVKKIRQIEDIFPCRINQILLQIAYAPNVITEQDLIDAQKIIL